MGTQRTRRQRRPTRAGATRGFDALVTRFLIVCLSTRFLATVVGSMAHPSSLVIGVVGKPSVGKSTFFNRYTLQAGENKRRVRQSRGAGGLPWPAIGVFCVYLLN
jgi:hypothetical protein